MKTMRKLEENINLPHVGKTYLSFDIKDENGDVTCWADLQAIGLLEVSFLLSRKFNL